MKIKVKEIPRDGLQINETIDAEKIGLIDDEFKVVSPLKITGEVHRSRTTITSELQVSGKYEFSCARCLEKVVVPRKDDIALDTQLEPTDDIFDLGEEIRQEIILDVPNIVLCKPDCRGLCPGCGVNLNNEKCKCK